MQLTSTGVSQHALGYLCLGHSDLICDGGSCPLHIWCITGLSFRRAGLLYPDTSTSCVFYKRVIIAMDYLKGERGDLNYISSYIPKYVVEVMTRRLGTAGSQFIPTSLLCAPEPPTHSAAIYSHVHGIKYTHTHAHKEAYSSPDFPQTHLICTVVVAAGGLCID